MTDFIEIAGERVSTYEAGELVRMLCNDAKQIAGMFHNMERAPIFRANWPNEYLYADANWKNFLEAARAMYAERLGDPKTPPAEARKMHLALVLQTMAEQGAQNDTRLQLTPNTQQFVGDPYENKKTTDRFGRRSLTFMELLMSSAGGSRRFH